MRPVAHAQNTQNAQALFQGALLGPDGPVVQGSGIFRITEERVPTCRQTPLDARGAFFYIKPSVGRWLDCLKKTSEKSHVTRMRSDR